MFLGDVVEPAIEIGGRNPHRAGLDDPPQLLEQRAKTGSRPGRDGHDRDVRHEAQPVADVGQNLFAAIARDEIPFVREHEGRTAVLAQERRHPRILVRYAVGGIHDEQRHVRSLEGAQRHERASVLARPLPASDLAKACRIDQHVVVAVAGELDVDRIARRARRIGDDDAIFAVQAIRDRALAHIRSPDDRDAQRRAGCFFAIGADFIHGEFCHGDLFHGECREDRFEGIEGAATVLSRDGEGVSDSEAEELVHALAVLARPINLVDEQRKRLARAPQRGRDRLVLGDQARLAVDDEQDHVGACYRRPRLRLNRRLEPVAFRDVEARRVDEPDLSAVDLDPLGDAVAGQARLVRHDRAAVARIAIEECRLADIGPADEGDDGKGL